jgi:hypothetical protein
MRSFIAVAAAVALCACARNVGPTQADTDAALKSGFEAAKADCQSRFPVSPRHNHAAYARCLHEYNASVMSRVGYPDLLVVISTKRIELAEKVDKGEISEAEADAQLAQTRAWAIGEETRRNNGAMQTQAQMAAAQAARVQAINSASPTTLVVQPQCTILVGGRCQ